VKLFFYDTETTGLPDFKAPSDAPHQPHIVQFAGQLVCSETRRVLASIDLIAKPEGWTIPDDVAAVHGITTEHAMDVGVAEAVVVEAAYSLWKRADVRVAHNEQFDARIVRIALKRASAVLALAEEWKAGRAECTAAMSTPLCKMPPTEKMLRAGFTNFKTPKLSEAHEILLGQPLVNAHSALADVDGCRRIYWHMKDLEQAVAA
jgi:DNA polymerase-3 subunit epsilon